MPNLKIFVDLSLPETSRRALAGTLGPLRDLLIDRLSVPVAACQLAVIPVEGLPDQPLINVEMQILPAPDRTGEMLTGLANEIRDLIARTVDAHPAIRISHLDPKTYVAVK